MLFSVTPHGDLGKLKGGVDDIPVHTCTYDMLYELVIMTS